MPGVRFVNKKFKKKTKIFKFPEELFTEKMIQGIKTMFFPGSPLTFPFLLLK